jgi:hypothetical protein
MDHKFRPYSDLHHIFGLDDSVSVGSSLASVNSPGDHDCEARLHDARDLWCPPRACAPGARQLLGAAERVEIARGLSATGPTVPSLTTT